MKFEIKNSGETRHSVELLKEGTEVQLVVNGKILAYLRNGSSEFKVDKDVLKGLGMSEEVHMY